MNVACPIALTFSLASSAFAGASPEAPAGNNEEAVAMIQMDLNSDSRLKGTQIRVGIENGIAILEGKSGSLAQAERAGARAIASSSVKALVNKVEIGELPAPEMLKAARAILKQQKMIRANDINVAVSDSRLTLTGEVGTWDEKELARELVSSVPGVKVIENRLVENFEGVRTDSQIEEQLKYIIQDDPLYEGLHLTVSAKEGTVRLGGTVGSKGEFDRLVRRSYVTGVMDVQISGLNIDSDLAMEGLEDKDYTPEQSLAAFREALAKDSRVDASGIRPALEDGTLILKGTVAGREAKDVVEATGRAIPGVLRVSNELKVSKAGELAAKTPERLLAASQAPGKAGGR